jgi:hypothetical protein
MSVLSSKPVIVELDIEGGVPKANALSPQRDADDIRALLKEDVLSFDSFRFAGDTGTQL